MTAKCALAKELLSGKVINVKSCFMTVGLTNCSREISRMIEKPYGLIVSRTHMEGKSKHGQPVTWVNYRLNNTPQNQEGIQKLIAYVQEQEGTKTPKTTKEEKQQAATKQITQLHQPQLFQ